MVMVVKKKETKKLQVEVERYARSLGDVSDNDVMHHLVEELFGNSPARDA